VIARLRTSLLPLIIASLLTNAALAAPLAPTAGHVPPKSAWPMVLAQATDPRVFQMEEQMRQLNGRIEELNFMVLELQEMIRKMQQDNEFRFQELEAQKQGNAGPKALPGATDGAGDGNALAGNAGTGTPPQNLGAVTFDANGNIVGGNAGTAPGATASIPAGLADAELFDSAYALVLTGDYGAAESALKEHVSRFPASERTSDARYWLGEAQLGQARYSEAAESFLAVSRDYPQAPRAPEALLKLGVAMAGLNKNDLACATFNEVLRRYPESEGALRTRVETERAAAQC
jgi:tol-pal system protein YbgF